MYYTKEHEWISVDNGIATIGITDHAQSNLGDVVYVELPRINSTVSQSNAIAVVESSKSVSDVYAPLDGIIIEINNSVIDEPSTINSDAQGEGWLFKMQLSDESQLNALMNETEYNEFIQNQ